MAILTSAQELQPHVLIPSCVFVQSWHQQDCLGTQHCPLWKRRWIIHVRYFSSSHHPRALLSISSIVTVDWCYISAPPPSGKHTEELNNFPIYMHGGIRYHSNAVRHSIKCRPRTTRRCTNILRLDSRSRRAFRPLQLVITVRIKQEKFKCFHARQVRFPLQVWPLDTAVLQNTKCRWRNQWYPSRNF